MVADSLVSSKHPDYSQPRADDWLLCRSAYEGEAFVKRQGVRYLPKPSGYSIAGGHPDNGEAAYNSYKMRAEFPEIMASSVGAMLGIIHQREIQIEIPAAMEYLRENADSDGRTLDDLHKQVTRNLLVSGRYGLLADAPQGGGQPFLAGYCAEAIVNWDREFYVLDESDYQRNGFQWDWVEAYRVLELVDGAYVQTYHEGSAPLDITPNALGGGRVTRVPFAVANAKEASQEIHSPPLVGIARAAMDIYQLSADQRLQLFMSGQETLVSINGPAPSAVGAGVVHEMMGSEGITPDLKYVSPTCAGIDAHDRKISERKEAAAQAGARMFERGNTGQESGDARRLRFQSETANLMTVAQSSCALLERGLRNVAMLLGQNEAEVVVKPPADLLDPTISAQEVATLWGVVMEGGMSWETFYERTQKGGIMSAERDAKQEYALIDGRILGADSPDDDPDGV